MHLGNISEEDFFDITPARRSVDRVLKSHMPDIQTSWRELLDNSLSAAATQVRVYFEMEGNSIIRELFPEKHEHNCPMVYFDDGTGISTKKGLQEALTIKENLSKKTYNVYGVGWKSTIASLAEKVTIITRSENGPILVAQYDCSVPEWILPIKNVEDLDEHARLGCMAEWEKYSSGSETGTLQLFEDLKVDYGYQKLENALFTNKDSLGYWYHGVNEKTPFEFTLNEKKLEFVDPFQRDLKDTRTLYEGVHVFKKKDWPGRSVEIGAYKTPDDRRGRKGTGKKIQKRTKFSRIVLRIDGRIIGTDLEMKVFGKYADLKRYFPLLAIDINVSSKDFGGGDDVPIPPNKTTTNKNSFSAEFLRFLKKSCTLEKIIKDFAENRSKEDKIKISKSVEKQVKDLAAAISKNARFLPPRDALIEDRKSPTDETKSKKPSVDSKERKRELNSERQVLTRTSKYNVNVLYTEGQVPHYNFRPVGKKYEIDIFANHSYWYCCFFNQEDVPMGEINERDVGSKLALVFAEVEKYTRGDLTTEEANMSIEEIGNFMIELHQ